MKLIKTPTKGMNDYLPGETALREYVKGVIAAEYASQGFMRIETPAVEHIENLTGKNGGENEKLIFKILKRGEKLDASLSDPDELCDSGLRYDLTVPLVRYYSNNSASLPMPFQALQIGNVWRADRPQKGRFRQFTQCDIDIIGDATCNAEISLISATAGVLNKLGFKNFSVRINDRRLLRAAALSCGFPEDRLESVFIILDKFDKIGADGVRSELIGEGFSESSCDEYMKLYTGDTASDAEKFASEIGNGAEQTAKILSSLMKSAATATPGGVKLVFDPTLVRGMSYYTGTIFEITMDGYGYSVGGGGRYDGMIGKFTGQNVPACGFSLGFERIVGALADSGFRIPGTGSSVVIFAEKELDEEQTAQMYVTASLMRSEGSRVLVTPKMKNVGFQKKTLEASGWREFYVWGKDGKREY